MPAKADKKKTARTASAAEVRDLRGKKSRQSRGKGRRTKKDNKTGTGKGAGTSQSSDVTDQTTLTLADAPDTRYTPPPPPPPPPPPMEPELSGRCPSCSSTLKPVLDSAGHPTLLLQCPRCPAAQPLCEQCLYPRSNPTCSNKSCQLVAMLLTCETVTDSSSKVRGCPLFRACPKCRNLMMHARGCKYVFCTHCNYWYCFICLCSKEECSKDKNKYWSLKCSKPRAARQRFQT